MDAARARSAVRELLFALGEDPDAAGLRETPARVAATWAELLSGRDTDPRELLGLLEGQPGSTGQVVAVGDLRFRSVCEHHLLPFSGVAHLLYRPGPGLVGVGSLARVVDALASRLQLQERLGDQIADAVVEGAGADGVVVVLTAHHGCLSERGARQADAAVTTIATRGSLSGASLADVAALLHPSAT